MGVLIGDPTLSLKHLLNVLVDVTEWENLGAALEIKPAKVKAIARNKNNHVARCKYDLMDHWLRSDLSASWQKLMEALTDPIMEGDHTVTIEAIRTTRIAPGEPLLAVTVGYLTDLSLPLYRTL